MRIMRVIAVSIACLGLACGQAMAQDSQDLTAMVEVLQLHDVALNAQDIDGVMAGYASNPNIVLMGTGPGEFWLGPDAISDTYEKFFEDFDPGTLVVTCPWKNGGVEGDAGWFVASCLVGDAKQGATREYVLNISAVFTKQDGAWRLQTLHASNLTNG